MKAVDANLLDLLKKSTQFVVPIYQRVYSWEESECERLWNDILHAGIHEGLEAHFTGAIVYVEKEQSTKTSAEPDLLIDGQQRVTTVTLILAALASHLSKLPPDEQEPVDGFSPKKITGRYLLNEDEEGDRIFKLILSSSDADALRRIIKGVDSLGETSSRVEENYEYFLKNFARPEVDLVSFCLGLRKLRIVDVTLTRGEDNPQLVFETMNATGKKLSQADLIRNFVLMDLPPGQQISLYQDYWLPMESAFRGSNEDRFDEFVRHFLTIKTGSTPKVDHIYEAFKKFTQDQTADNGQREKLVAELSRYSVWFARMAFGVERDPKLSQAFAEIEQLRATVTYPFLLKTYELYEAEGISNGEFLEILEVVISYLFRRAVRKLPTNSHRTTFALLASTDFSNFPDHVERVKARFLTLNGVRRFPADKEFQADLTSTDLYNFRPKSYLLGKLENFKRKELVHTSDYTVEHIMPQNKDLSLAWRRDLGDDWQEIQERLLHTLGNITLTGYNPEYSDRPFPEKRDMTGGFSESPLRLNEGLGQLETWNEQAIEDRANKLSKQALAMWPKPKLSEEQLSKYVSAFSENEGFDWELLHQILDRLPAGRWTGYFYLAEAVGTAPQPLANHVATCLHCAHPYRVLTWNGKIAKGFAWTDEEEKRDPQKVLEAEGVEFSDNIANPEQKMETEELLALLEN
jgi:uncharacterized protein with ParB-like and HNH nuclease domain